MMQKVLDVHIGEIKIAKNGEILQAILGSCVGIAILWKEKSLCGLAHCLLPESPTPTMELGAKFVDQAIRSLMTLMEIRPEHFPSVALVIVGGGNMTKPGAKNSSDLVGSNYFKAAMNEANKHHLPILYSEGGGEVGRKLMIDSALYTYKIEEIPRIAI